MREIDIRPYKVVLAGPEGKKEVDYDVRSSIESVLLATGPATEQRLSMTDLLRNARVAEKILGSKDVVLLEESEYAILRQAFDSYKGFGQFEVELCKRITGAKQVEVRKK